MSPKHISTPKPSQPTQGWDIERQTRFNSEGQAITPTEPPKEPKPSYPQDWAAYDKAKTNEDGLFKELLIELSLIAQEERLPKPGRTGHLTWEKILSMCLKEYYKSDLRKTQSILKSLQQAQKIPRVPGYRSIDRFYNDKDLTPLLEKLILISALPLANVEITGAVDSTGFSVRKYKSWNEAKWHVKNGTKERVWVKLHAWCGTKTNIFVSAKITPSDVGDAPMLKEVIGNNTLYFQMKQFVADKAYSSREILSFIEDMNMNPYIPFKKNANGKAKGFFIWKKMYNLFKTKNDEYMTIYHQRSNVETCFHMLKTRFGDRLLTKNLTANQNEILARILCHNLCVLIQETFERDLQTDFKAAYDEITRDVTN